MAVYFKMNILGLNLLAFITLSHSFVLLTANMDDVKKLAKKFVSETLAEQIADFIAKLSTNPVDVSEENEKNMEQYSQTSGEHSRNKELKREPNLDSFVGEMKVERHLEKNHLKQKKKASDVEPTLKWSGFPTEIKINDEFIPNTIDNGMQNYNDKDTEIMLNQDKQQRLGVHKNKHRLSGIDTEHGKGVGVDEINEINPDDTNTNQNDITDNPEEILKHHLNRPTENAEKKHELKNKNPQLIKKQRKRRNKPRFPNASTISSTVGYPEKYSDPNPSRYRFGQTNVEENQTNFIDDIQNNNQENVQNENTQYAGDNVERADKELTTAKEIEEFDQYDNKNYPKSEFVATSGSVALTKKRKVWF